MDYYARMDAQRWAWCGRDEEAIGLNCEIPNGPRKGGARIDDLGLSVRAFNCLKRAGIDTVDELLRFRYVLVSLPGFGPRSLTDVERALKVNRIELWA
jgi:DNA-directed RNA polymerase alpha subunit